jgi:LytS/YehU family sensor histidine kinase
MLSIVVADRVAADRPGSRLPYVVAVIVSAAVSTPLESIFGSLFVEPVFRWKDVVQNGLYFFFDWLVLAGTATFVYVDRRRAHDALARMHAAQMERAQSARRTLESRLQAMQARVEPQFLFNTLARVRDLYRKDSHRGERTLDELIAYLRAAMPRMRDTSSTVGQELDLARAYLGIERLRVGDRLVVEVQCEPGIADVRMPPMMLLPLVDHALGRDLDSMEAASLRIRTTVSNGKVRVALACAAQAVREREGDGLSGIRERLAELYGAEASLIVHGQDKVVVETILEVPCHAAAPDEGVADPHPAARASRAFD